MFQSQSEGSQGMARTVAAENAGSSSELHVSDYSLPSSSRLPKAILGGVAGTIVLVAGLYYVFKWFCRSKLRQADSGEEDGSDDERPTTVIVVTDLGAARASKQVIEQAVWLQLEAIPAIGYEEWLRRNAARAGEKEEEEEVCAVCLGELSGVGSMVKVLPGCGHCFHSSCIDVWLVARASCPVCRAKL